MSLSQSNRFLGADGVGAGGGAATAGTGAGIEHDVAALRLSTGIHDLPAVMRE